MRLFVLLALVLLTACATPREACIARADRDLATVRSLIAQTEANLRRGYGYEIIERTVVVTELCLGRKSDRISTQFCNRLEPVRERRPVAIDPAAENRKLDLLRARETRLASQAQTAIARCEAAHPS